MCGHLTVYVVQLLNWTNRPIVVESAQSACVAPNAAMGAIFNSTDSNNSTVTTEKLSPTVYVYLSVHTISSIALIIGLLSWIFIKKFRHFKNYVFLNIIFLNILNAVFTWLYENAYVEINCKPLRIALGFSYLYVKVSVNCWLLILCYVFYRDLVKVFSSDISRRYLKSNLFCWGVPLILSVWCIFVMPFIVKSGKITAPIFITLMLTPLVVNFFIYLRVLYALLTDIHAVKNRCQRIQVCTVIFFVSGFLMLLMPLRLCSIFPNWLIIILGHLQAVAMDFYFFFIRMNRTVWMNYFRNIKWYLELFLFY